MIRNNTELQKQIVAVFLESVNIEVPSVHEDLIETGLLDSLKIVELLTELERRFRLRISLSDVDINGFRSIARIADFVANHSCDEMPDAISSASVSRETQPQIAE